MAISFSSLSGGTSFTVVTSTGGSKTATLDKSYPAGTYLIESKALDTNLEVYLGASDGTPVGSAVAGAKTVTATSSFLYVTTVNADANDAVIFTLKSAASLATKTDATWAPPTITDITPSGLPNVNDTTTITGTNFASNVEVKFRKSDDSTLVTPKTTVRGSATSIIAGRPDSFAVGDAPYDVIVTNPTTTLSASSLNAITSGAVPVWVTSTTLNEATLDTAFSQTISATDADGSSTITYAIVSGAFQTGLSFNTSTGAITGTPTGSSGSTTIVISATDSGGNAVNRTFTQVINSPVLLVDYLVIAGGGGGGSGQSGGGGAGGLRSTVTATGGGGTLESTLTLINNTSYSVILGAGGAGGQRTSNSNGAKGASGSNSSISGSGITTITSTGGGYGGAYSDGTGGVGGSGGSGGGAGNHGTGHPIAGGARTTSPVQGYAGGSATDYQSPYSGAGGGGAGAVGQNSSSGVSASGGNGLAVSITGSSVTYAGGGGSGNNTGLGTNTSGGAGGGGAGATQGAGSSGSSNTGGGGGGGSWASAVWNNGGSGGSGKIILRYAGTTQRATGGTITTSGNYTIHTFDSSGIFYTGTGTPKATGGTITRTADYWIHTFTGTDSFVPTQSLTADYLVIAGGGGGGGATNTGSNRAGGGGGAGGLRSTVTATGRGGSLETPVTLNSGTTYTITVGSGGARGTTSATGSNGINSSISGTGLTTITSSGGGGGGTTEFVGSNGGSGGGGGGTVNSKAGGTGINGQGYDGGSSSSSFYNCAAGGGGAGANGSNTSAAQTGANGGAGVAVSISGVSTTYAGGGGGGGELFRSNGGSGGGGKGALQQNGSLGGGNSQNAEAGIINTGSGGGGSCHDTGWGGEMIAGAGGSGIVIIRYPV